MNQNSNSSGYHFKANMLGSPYGSPDDVPNVFTGTPYSGSPGEVYIGNPNIFPSFGSPKAQDDFFAADSATSQEIGPETQLSPFTLFNSRILRASTMATMDWLKADQTIKRQESMFPGLSRSLSSVATTPTVTHTYAAPTAGQISKAAVIYLQVSMPTIQAIPHSIISVGLVGVDENGAAVNNDGWNLQFHDQEAALVAFFQPYSERATKLFPLVVNADGTNNLVITISGLVTGSVVTTALCADNWYPYMEFKVLRRHAAVLNPGISRVQRG